MKSKTGSSLKALVIAGLALAATSAQASTDAEARALLKAMSDYIGSLNSIESSVDTSLEVVTPQMEKIAFTSTSLLKMARPNGVHLQRTGSFANVELLFDGANLTVRDRGNNVYAQVPVKGTTEDLVTAVQDQLGMAVPGADLLLRDSYSVLVADVLEAKLIGEGVIAGQRCDHVAFRNFDTDWQLWIRQGAEKIPCKMIITSKTVGMAPQYTTHVRSWISNPKFPAGTFTFKPAPGEQRLDLGKLAVDEIPQSTSAGAQK